MTKRNLSLSSRIFFYMILLVVLASILIAVVTVYQYNEQSQDYHRKRLERKEAQLISSINYVLKESSWEIKTENLPLIFKDKIYEIANIHNVTFNLYDLKGHLLKSSKARLKNDPIPDQLPNYILDTLSQITSKRFVEKNKLLDGNYRSSYLIFNNPTSKPIGILNVPYFDDDSLNSGELKEFLIRLGYAYIIMMLVAIAFAYFMSKLITKSIKTISDKMYATRFEKQNKKIALEGATTEIKSLVESYNNMIDALEESAQKLASSEREQAWREMAKQVAHEVKNPLTPMRLSVQSFQRMFDPKDPEIHKKVDEYSKTLIQQIDTMSKIAEAFSNFAKMPAQNLEKLDIVEVVERALEIFPSENIKFSATSSQIIVTADKDQINRIVNNLVKNAIQSVPENKIPNIEVELSENDEHVCIKVKDNGSGIDDTISQKIFEPKFTTKTSGMGLGLPMIKNIIETYNGSISYDTTKGEGTVFVVSFPIK
jgi:two-component system nitrogen regulation sensor histidine kinase NtrY